MANKDKLAQTSENSLTEGTKVKFYVKIRAQAENLLVLGVGVLGLVSSFFMNSKGGSYQLGGHQR